MTGHDHSDVDDALSDAECIELLASQCRQTLLEQLASTSDESHSLESLASDLTGSDDVAQFQEVSLSLHHVHLPKLDEADVVDYDPNSKTVEYHETAPVERLLSRL